VGSKVAAGDADVLVVGAANVIIIIAAVIIAAAVVIRAAELFAFEVTFGCTPVPLPCLFLIPAIVANEPSCGCAACSSSVPPELGKSGLNWRTSRGFLEVCGLTSLRLLRFQHDCR
jgi:hypothetical protein